MLGVRVDPSRSSMGYAMTGSTARTSRLTIGEAAALVALGKLPALQDISITSLTGSNEITMDIWKEEFERAAEPPVPGDESKVLFTTSFTNVPDTGKLANWLTRRWFPKLLKTIEIDTDEARKVLVGAVREPDSNIMHIRWMTVPPVPFWRGRKKEEMELVLRGAVAVEITKTGLVARREGGDVASGFGEVNEEPLPGEDIIVPALAEAASLAIARGLAEKKSEAKHVSIEIPRKISPPVYGNEEKEVPKRLSMDSSGPRRAGARRSYQRPRGSRMERAESIQKETTTGITKDFSSDAPTNVEQGVATE